MTVSTATIKNLGLKEYIFGVFLFYAFAQCISLAVANISLVLLILLSVIYGLKHPDEIKQNAGQCKSLLIFLGLLFTGLLLSALTSGDVLEGIRVCFERYAYRSSPLLILLLILPKRKYVVPLIWVGILSCIVTVIGGFIQGPKMGWRIQALYGHPMTLAGFLCVCLPIVFESLFESLRPYWKLFLKAVIFGVLAAALLCNGTRGAWLAVATSFAVIAGCIAFRSKRNLMILAAVLICVGVGFSSSDRFEQRAESITSQTMQSNTERLLMWQSAFEMYKDHPVFGVGLGQYPKQYQQHYIKPEAKERAQNHAHNNVIHLMGETGTAGVLGFLLFFGFVFFSSGRHYLKTKKTSSLILFTMTLAWFLQGLTEYNFGNAGVIRYFWMYLGCFWVLSYLADADSNLKCNSQTKEFREKK